METTVIIGNGVAGTNAAATLRKNGYEGAIKLIGEEAALPYQRPPLSKAWLRGPDRPKLTPIRPLSFYDDNRIELIRARKVFSIDRPARNVRFSDGKTTKFDTLILATGASPRRLDVQGVGLKGIHYLRHLGDSAGLRQALASVDCRDVVIIGAGVIGLPIPVQQANCRIWCRRPSHCVGQSWRWNRGKGQSCAGRHRRHTQYRACQSCGPGL